MSITLAQSLSVHVQRGAGDRYAGVVDQDGDRPEFGFGLSEGMFDTACISNVHAHALRFRAAGADRRHGVCQRRLSACGDGDLCAGRGKHAGEVPAEPAGRPGHQRVLAA